MHKNTALLQLVTVCWVLGPFASSVAQEDLSRLQAENAALSEENQHLRSQLEELRQTLQSYEDPIGPGGTEPAGITAIERELDRALEIAAKSGLGTTPNDASSPLAKARKISMILQEACSTQVDK